VIPISVMVTNKGTVSQKIKGKFSVGNPSKFSEYYRPIVTWNLTYKCNLRCIHCYIKAGPEGNHELNGKVLFRIAEDIVKHNIPMVIMSGGEPLLRREIYDLARYLNSNGVKLVLSSNGTLITKEIAEKLWELEFRYVGVSLDSVDPKWHDNFRGVSGAYEAAIKGLMNAKAYDLPVGIRFTVTSKNISDVPRILDLAIDNEVERLTFYHLSSSGRAKDMDKSWYLNATQYIWFIDKLIHYSREYAGRIEIQTTLAPFDGIYVADRVARDKKHFWKCIELVKAQGGCGRKFISIYPNGMVYPCQFVDFYPLGNVLETGLADILRIDGNKLDYFIETHKYLKGPKCSNCPFKFICQGGDRVRAYYLGGSLYADDPQCHLDIIKIANRWEYE